MTKLTYGQIRERLVAPLERAGFSVASKIHKDDMVVFLKRKLKFEVFRGDVRITIEAKHDHRDPSIFKTLYFISGGGGLLVTNWDTEADIVQLQSVIAPSQAACRIFLDLVEQYDDRNCVTFACFE